jgi:hypothetical protein
LDQPIEREKLSDLINRAPKGALQDAFTQAAQQVPADEYREHIMPGLGGTDPLGQLARGALPQIAGALINAYIQNKMGGAAAGRSRTGQTGPMGPLGPFGPATQMGQGGPFGQSDQATQGGGLGDLINKIPGLRTTDPNQMDPNDVAVLSDYMRDKHPDVFGKAASEVGRKDPNILEQLLGNKALMMGAAVLAAKVLSDQSKRRRAA